MYVCAYVHLYRVLFVMLPSCYPLINTYSIGWTVNIQICVEGSCYALLGLITLVIPVGAVAIASHT